MNQKNIFAGMLIFLGVAVFNDNLKAGEFIITETAPPRIKAWLEAAKKREEARVRATPHVESRVRLLKESEGKPSVAVNLQSHGQFQSGRVKSASEEMTADEKKLAELEEKLRKRKEAYAKAEEQMTATSEALYSLEETLDHLHQNAEVNKVETPKQEVAEQDSSLPMPTNSASVLPVMATASSLSNAEVTPTLITNSVIDLNYSNAKSSYQLIFVKELVVLKVQDLSFKIEIIDGHISIQPLKN